MNEMAWALACLVALLGDPRWPVREAAEQALGQSGAVARPWLMNMRQSPDPETRMRARRLLDALPGSSSETWPQEEVELCPRKS